MSSVSLIKGFQDLLPAEAARFTRMEAAAREVFARYGYREIRVPVVEKTELFARSIGEETDVVSKEMFTFPDRKGRSMTLRPEATAGVVRAYLEHKLFNEPGPAKLFTFGPMFRYERPQKGRQRQFHQIDAECLGADSALADAEMIIMLARFLEVIGLKGLTLELNTLGCPECRPAYRQQLAGFLGHLDHERFCEDCRRRVGTNPLRVLDCKVPACKEMTAGAPAPIDAACPACGERFAAVRRLLDAAHVGYRLSPRLVRGLDYYQRTTFEMTASLEDGKIGAQTAVAGGGRYDGLTRLLGGPDMPGVGFACGMERLALLMSPDEPAAPDFFLAPLAPECLPVCAELAETLRGRGLSGEAAYEAKSMKAQMRAADRSGARFILVIGPDELAEGKALVKNMRGGEQRTLAFAELQSTGVFSA